MTLFNYRHYNQIATLLGSLNEPTQLIQQLTNKFGEFFEKDNERFDFKRFQSKVTRVWEGIYGK